MFKPKTLYGIDADKIQVKDFFDYKTMYVTRPPYQRKSVWSEKKQQSLLDSLFRNYYIPKLVLREIRKSDSDTVHEVVDGQQRITTVQNFFANKIKLPESLKNINPNIHGKLYSQLPDEIKLFADKKLKFDVDVIKNIDDPKSPEHQKIATDIFWRLQQGEALNFMEIAHARLSSLTRNFIVKYSDDISFDYSEYLPIDENKNKHAFFKMLDRKNDRMQNLSLFGRMLLLEIADGPADIRDANLGTLIESTKEDDGVGNESYEETPAAKSLLSALSLFVDIFKDDTMIDDQNGIKELKVEYFILSLFLLLRYVRIHYVIDDIQKTAFRDFTLSFHERWKGHREDDPAIQYFQNNRQQSSQDLEARDHVIRQLYFEFLAEKKIEIKSRDSQRSFNEAQRIQIYRRDRGLCQLCLADNKPEKEAIVSWKQYQADHIIPWIKGGTTDVGNAQVLCVTHNAQKGGN